MTTDQLTPILAALRAQFEALYGERLHKMLLYGSQARGDADSGSDIDVMVVLAGEVNPFEEIERTGDIVLDISLENNVVVSCVFISKTRFEKVKNPLLLNVHKEGIEI